MKPRIYFLDPSWVMRVMFKEYCSLLNIASDIKTFSSREDLIKQFIRIETGVEKRPHVLFIRFSVLDEKFSLISLINEDLGNNVHIGIISEKKIGFEKALTVGANCWLFWNSHFVYNLTNWYSDYKSETFSKKDFKIYNETREDKTE